MSAPATGSSAFDVAALRAREFPWLDAEGTTYLNAASTGPLPERTVRALDAFARRRTRPHEISWDEQFGTTRRARELFAGLVGGRADEIALMPNTSYGVNLAAQALPWGAGDEVVLSDGEFPANVYPWLLEAERRGARVHVVPRAHGLPDEDALVAALDRRGVRVLAVSWVQFATGHRADLARLGAACRERGIAFVVDAIQGVGALPLDARACGIDVLACGAQKWLLSPWGTGFAWVRRELVERLSPPEAGWLSVRHGEDFGRLTDYELSWRDDARRFEVGTIAHGDYAGVNASLELLAGLGADAVAAHVRALADRIVRWAEAHGDVARLVTPADAARRAGIVALAPADAAAAERRLHDARVVFSPREGMVRLAVHCFNTVGDVDIALRALEG